MGLLSILGGFTVFIAFILLFSGVGLRRGSFGSGDTEISGPIFFILLVMGILIILGDIAWPFF